jgi:hypothetical protein
VSAGAVGAALGVLGYFLGARWLGAATIVLGVIAVFFMAAAATGLVPGVEPLEGVMNFSPNTIASAHGYSKTIPQ